MYAFSQKCYTWVTGTMPQYEHISSWTIPHRKHNLSIIYPDLKLHLQCTDYGAFLANEPSPLAVSVIDDRLREKLVIEFQHMRNVAVEPLATFLDYITWVPS